MAIMMVVVVAVVVVVASDRYLFLKVVVSSQRSGHCVDLDEIQR